MADYAHGFTIDAQRCAGRLACMRACPTQAIRVKSGKARLRPELCIDCGLCLRVCPSGAIRATTRSYSDLDRFKYKVAVPSPVLFGQFPSEITPGHIAAGLRGIGFDAVWDFGVEVVLAGMAIRDYVESWKGPYPLISISCPVVVRLVQVLYPDMIGQLIPIQPPRELAGRELKRRYSEELGIDPAEIAAVYITPCQAKTISILQPAEGAASNLEGALGISDVYNDILTLIRAPGKGQEHAAPDDFVCNAETLRWCIDQGQGRVLPHHRRMTVTGLSNVIQVFDDIEKGKLRNIEYLECDACWGGCISGNLTVDNVYVTLSKIRHLLAQSPDPRPQMEAEVQRRYPNEVFSLEGRVTPRVVEEPMRGLKERVKRIKTGKTVVKTLPGLDCGLCGAPTCQAFAKDVAAGTARQGECVFFSSKRLKHLRRTYLRGEKRRPNREP